MVTLESRGSEQSKLRYSTVFKLVEGFCSKLAAALAASESWPSRFINSLNFKAHLGQKASVIVKKAFEIQLGCLAELLRDISYPDPVTRHNPTFPNYSCSKSFYKREKNYTEIRKTQTTIRIMGTSSSMTSQTNSFSSVA